MALWTLKEAVVKAKGTGINAAPGLKGFSVGMQQQPTRSTCMHNDSVQEDRVPEHCCIVSSMSCTDGLAWCTSSSTMTVLLNN